MRTYGVRIGNGAEKENVAWEELEETRPGRGGKGKRKKKKKGEWKNGRLEEKKNRSKEAKKQRK